MVKFSVRITAYVYRHYFWPESKREADRISSYLNHKLGNGVIKINLLVKYSLGPQPNIYHKLLPHNQVYITGLCPTTKFTSQVYVPQPFISQVYVQQQPSIF